jgi:hypothetical protein
MQLPFRKGYDVSEKDEKRSPRDPSSSLSSSGLPSTDRSLERLLGAIAKGLDGLVQGNLRIAKGQEDLVQGNLELRQAFADLQKVIYKHTSRTENRITDLQTAVDEFIQRVEAVVEHQKTATGATVDARRALDKSKTALDEFVKEHTGKIKLLRPEDEEGAAPLVVRQIVVRVTNFVWPTAVRRGPDAIRWGFTIISGSGVITWLGHFIWQAVHGG